jgi:hypothetical protein
MAASATAMVVATVSNDSSNAGVDWSCSPAGSCGSFNPAHTASGQATTYTAPATAGSTTLQATSTANHAATATANVTVSSSSGGGSSTLGSGTFAFYVSGEDSKAQTYAIAGSFALDASGNVTGGEQDYNSIGGATSPQPGGDTITGGKLTLGSGGRSSLTLITNNSAAGVSGTETFDVAVVNTKHALIAEFDGSATSSGSIDMQTLSPGGLAQVSGPFVLVVSGKFGTKQETFGGLMVGAGDGTLHVTIDQNQGGSVTLAGTNTGTYTAPDASGRGTIAFGGDNGVYYVVNDKVFRVLVVNIGETVVGSAFAGVTSASNAALNGKLFFTDASNLSSGASYVAAGELTADGNGNASGFADVDENGHATSAAFTGAYSVNSSGYGSITINPGNTQDIAHLGLYLADPTINFSDPNSPADAGLRGLLIDLDTNIVGSGALIVPPSQTPTLAGTFAFGIQTSNSDHEADAVGVATVAGTSFTGTEDLNDLFNTGRDTAIALSGTLVPDQANPGRYTIPVSVMIGTTQQVSNYVIYLVSETQAVLIEADPQFGAGMLEKQN